MKILIKIVIGVIISVVGGSILLMIYQPDIFLKGVNRMDWIILMKITGLSFSVVLFFIAAVRFEKTILFNNKYKRLKNDISQQIPINKTLKNINDPDKLREIINKIKEMISV